MPLFSLLSSRIVVKVVFALLILTLFACGGGSSGGGSTGGGSNRINSPGSPTQPDDTADSGITIDGTAAAPGGLVAQLDHQKSIINIAFNFILSSTYADIIGMSPVTGATVQLIRIDNFGNQIGGVLAETVTSSSGSYSLELPEGIDLSADLVVRISGTGVSMSALVVDEVVDINPLSQFVLKKLLGNSGIALKDLPVEQVKKLFDRLNEISVASMFDISTMLERLEAEFGEIVEIEIEYIKSTMPFCCVRDVGISNRNIVSVSLSFADFITRDVGLYSSGIFSANLDIEPESRDLGTGTINLRKIFSSSSIDLEVSTFFADKFAAVSHDVQAKPGDEIEINSGISVPVRMGESDVFIIFPSSTELEETTIGDPETDPEADGPDFGSSSISTYEVIDPVLLLKTDPSLASQFLDVVLLSNVIAMDDFYATRDTNNDGIKDDINPDFKIGSGRSVEMTIYMDNSPSPGTRPDITDGQFCIVSFSIQSAAVSNIPSNRAASRVGCGQFDSSGNATFPAIDEQGFTRQPINPNSVVLTNINNPGIDTTFPYIYTAFDDFTLQQPSGPTLSGFITEHSELFSMLGSSSVSSGDQVVSAEQEILFGFRKRSFLPGVPVALDDKKFELKSILYGASDAGQTRIFNFGRASRISFDMDTMTATAFLQRRGFERDTDVAEIRSIFDDSEQELVFSIDDLTIDGEITMSLVDGSRQVQLKGVVGYSGSIMALRYNEINGTNHTIGLIIAYLDAGPTIFSGG